MTIEEAVLLDFRAMDDETQREAAVMFRNLARDFPRGRKLQLVRNLASNVIALHPGHDGPHALPIGGRE